MLTVDSTVSKRYPGAKMGILAIRKADATAPLEASAVSTAMENIRARYGRLDRAELKTLHPIQAYVTYYKRFGYSYHVLAQLQSLLTGKRPMRAQTGLLQAMFLTELESMLLTAGHDLDKLQTPLRLRTAAGGETFRSIVGKDVQTVRDDLMVCSGGAIISSILRGPDYGSRITASTTNVLFTVYAPPGIESKYAEAMLQALEGRIRSFSPAANTTVMKVYES